MSGTAAEHLSRLLALVPYLLSRQGIPVEQAARDAGISEAQLEKDLSLLFLCGEPPYLPGDLIEAEWEEGRIFLGNADTIARPLRFGVDEVAALLVGLRLLAGLPGAHDRAALDRTIAKLQEVAGAVAGKAETQVGVAVGQSPDEAALADARRALRESRRLWLRYYVPWRDEATEREVDPMRVALVEGQPYLEGWCHRAEAVRLFRFDRILDLSVLDVPAEVPADAQARDLADGLFRPSPDDIVATLELERDARWVVEYYPCENVTDLGAGRTSVRIRAADSRWIVRLALRLGPTAQVVEPAEVVAEVRAEAAAALRLYDTAAAGSLRDSGPGTEHGG